MKTDYKDPMHLSDCPEELREAFLDTELEDDYWVEQWNNMSFYLMNVKRLRWKFAEMSSWGANVDHLREILGTTETEGFSCLAKYYGDWETLSKLSLKEMTQIVDENKLDWLGDDFEDMSNYIHMVECFTDGVAYRQTWTHEFKDSCMRVERLDKVTVNNFAHRLKLRVDEC